MKTLINATPHDVVIVDKSSRVYDKHKRKFYYVDNGFTNDKVVIAPSGLIANAEVSKDCTTIQVNNHDVVVEQRQVTGITYLDPNQNYIVSTQYVNACRALGKDTSNLYTPSSAVFDDDMHMVGTIGLVKN